MPSAQLKPAVAFVPGGVYPVRALPRGEPIKPIPVAPYFHDVSAKARDDAIDVMFRHQVGRVGSAGGQEIIVKLVNTLTGAPAGRP